MMLHWGRYNASDHPIAFHRGQDLSGGPKKIVAGAAPDIEDAFVVSDLSLFSTSLC